MTLNSDGECLSGDVPEGSLETAWRSKLSFGRLCDALMSEPSPPLCVAYSTRLVGLRRSLARIIKLLVLLNDSEVRVRVCGDMMRTSVSEH